MLTFQALYLEDQLRLVDEYLDAAILVDGPTRQDL